MFTVDVGVDIGHETIKVDFHYGEDNGLRVTECKVNFLSSLRLPQIGKAVCSPEDNFCKATGRKVALTRALRTLPRDLRKEVWDTYLERVKIKSRQAVNA